MDIMVHKSDHLSLAHLVSSNINAMSTMYVYIFNCESSSSTRANEICLCVCVCVCAICEIHLLKVHQANQSIV
jgi:hypothetical protein